MPSLAEIQQQIQLARAGAQDTIRKKFLRELHECTGRDTIVYASAFSSAKKLQSIPSSLYSISVDDLQGFMAAMHGLKGKKLDLILHSPGGSLDAADQIVQYLRAKYEHIRALVPQNAMSAATMLACACDEIVMGKHSALGPIDPQITMPTVHGLFTAPAQCILDDFEQAKSDVLKDPKLATLWAPKMRDYPPGILQVCQQTLKLAVEKTGMWLSTRMFSDFSDGEAKAGAIASWLGDAKEHKTHGRPIGFEAAKAKGLNVTSLESDPDLQEKLLSVFHATAFTFDITPCVKAIENHDGKGWFTKVDVKG